MIEINGDANAVEYMFLDWSRMQVSGIRYQYDFSEISQHRYIIKSFKMRCMTSLVHRAAAIY